MNTQSENQVFAESAKNGPEQFDGVYFDNPALNQATLQIMQTVLEKPSGPDLPIKPALAKSLRLIQTQQLYLGERNEDGKPIIPSFERFLKMLRRVFVAHASGHIGDAYKHVTEAVIYNKLQDGGASLLPVTRAQLQKLNSVDPEDQLAVWNAAIVAAAGADVTPLVIAKAAHVLGFGEVAMPAPSASSVLNNVRDAWNEFKVLAETECGPKVVKLFPRMDSLLALKRPKKDQAKVPNYNTDQSPQPATDASATPAQNNERKMNDQAISPVESNASAPIDLPELILKGQVVSVRFASPKQGGDFFRAGLHLHEYKLEDKAGIGLWERQTASIEEANGLVATLREVIRKTKIKVSSTQVK